MIPKTLTEWSLAKIRDLAASGPFENDFYDFKLGLQDSEGQSKIAAAFANAMGGFLVFGVSDTRDVIGVADPELPANFGRKLERIEPSVEYEVGRPIPVTDGYRLFVIHVPRSSRGPHAVRLSDARRVFLKRAPSGTNEAMSYEEIRAAFTEGEPRRGQLRFLRAEVKRITDLAERLNREAYAPIETAPDLRSKRYDTSLLKATLASVFAVVGEKPELVRHLTELRENADATDLALVPFAAKMPNGNDELAVRAIISRLAPWINSQGQVALRHLDEILGPR
jgi:hypothetical protein